VPQIFTQPASCIAEFWPALMSGRRDMLADRAGRDEPTAAAMSAKPKTEIATNRCIVPASESSVRAGAVTNESGFFPFEWSES
jgi:hypothetical protein